MAITAKSDIISRTLKMPIQYITRPHEQKMIQVAESYTPTTASDWTALDSVTTAPSTQDTALDYLATTCKNLEANDPDTIIEARGDMIVGNNSGEGIKLTVGTANQVLVSDGTDPGWTGTVTNIQLTTPTITTNGSIDVSGAGTLGIATSAGANAITIGGATSNVAVPGVINADNTTDASAGAGSIVCDGGVYVAKKVVFAANQQIDCAAGTFAIGATMGANALTLGGATSSVAVAGSLDVVGTIDADDTTDSSSVATGSIVCDGGVGIAKKLYVGTDLNVAGTSTLVGLNLSGDVDSSGKCDFQNNTAAGGSTGHILKGTMQAGETYTGSMAGLSIKNYDADATVVHTEDELCGLYINLKQLSAISGGGKSALISAHNYGSGGSYQVLDFGLRLFGDIVDAIEVTGGTVTSAIKLDTCSALTNVLKLADGAGCAVGSTMVKDPTNDAEAGFITIEVGGTTYQMPFWAIA